MLPPPLPSPAACILGTDSPDLRSWKGMISSAKASPILRCQTVSRAATEPSLAVEVSGLKEPVNDILCSPDPTKYVRNGEECLQRHITCTRVGGVGTDSPGPCYLLYNLPFLFHRWAKVLAWLTLATASPSFSQVFPLEQSRVSWYRWSFGQPPFGHPWLAQQTHTQKQRSLCELSFLTSFSSPVPGTAMFSWHPCIVGDSVPDFQRTRMGRCMGRSCNQFSLVSKSKE